MFLAKLKFVSWLVKRKRGQLGFTLIETIIAVAIVGLLLGFGLAQYNRFNSRQVLQQAAYRLRADLRLAQEKALAGKKEAADGSGVCPACDGDDDLCGTDDDFPLEGWYIRFVQDEPGPFFDSNYESYEVFGRCYDESGPASNEFSLKRTRLYNETAVKVIDTGLPAEIQFKVLGGGTDLVGEIGIRLTRSGVGEAVITMTESGEII